MIKVMIWEHESSKPETRELPVIHAHAMGKNGGFYKVQLIDENDIIAAEYK